MAKIHYKITFNKLVVLNLVFCILDIFQQLKVSAKWYGLQGKLSSLP